MEKRKLKLLEMKASTFVYATNLPEDITTDEMITFFGKGIF